MDGEKCHRKTHENYGKPVRFLTMPLNFIFSINNNTKIIILNMNHVQLCMLI